MVDHHTLGKRTTELLLEHILTGKYRPGQRLAYDLVANDLGVSLTPLKEAFLLLEARGLLVSVARRGIFVRQFKKEDVEELYEIREALEGLSIRLACRNVGEKDMNELHRIHKKLFAAIEKRESKNLIKYDIQFHEAIARLSRNARLFSMLTDSLYTNLFCITERENVFLNHSEQIVAHHEKLLLLLEKRDEEACERVMREQIRLGETWIIESMIEKTALAGGGDGDPG